MKGHVWRGVFGGFIFGILLSLTLFTYGVLDFASNVMWILPLLGILLGLVLAAWAPFGSGTTEASSDTTTGTDPAERESTLEQPPVDQPGNGDGGEAAI